MLNLTIAAPPRKMITISTLTKCLLALAVGHSGRYTVLAASKTKRKDSKHATYTIV